MKLFCPRCQELEISSRCYGLGSSITCMGYQPFYDEKGEFHNHDPNKTSGLFRCSHGHLFSIKRVNECPACDYGKGTEEITVIEK